MPTPYIYSRTLLICVALCGVLGCRQAQLTHHFKAQSYCCWWEYDLLDSVVVHTIWQKANGDTTLFWNYLYNRHRKPIYRIMASQVLHNYNILWQYVDTARLAQLYFQALTPFFISMANFNTQVSLGIKLVLYIRE